MAKFRKVTRQWGAIAAAGRYRDAARDQRLQQVRSGRRVRRTPAMGRANAEWPCGMRNMHHFMFACWHDPKVTQSEDER